MAELKLETNGFEKPSCTPMPLATKSLVRVQPQREQRPAILGRLKVGIESI
jgi:hypothetical protein